MPNYTRDVKKGIARWDAYLHAPDPDALAAEFSSRDVEFSEPLKDTVDRLRGFELEDADGYVAVGIWQSQGSMTPAAEPSAGNDMTADKVVKTASP